MGYIFCSRITFHFTFTSCLVSTSNFKIGNAKGFTQNFIYWVFTFSLVVCIFTCDSCFIYKHCICALMPVILMAGFFDIYSSRSDRYPAVLEWETTTWHDLSQVARGLLAVPATSTSSERSFSLAGRTLEERRTQLAGDDIDALLVLHGLEWWVNSTENVTGE